MVDNPLEAAASCVGWEYLDFGKYRVPVRRFVFTFREHPGYRRRADKYRKGYFAAGKSGRPVYAETAPVQPFQRLRREGWDARWIDSYRNKHWSDMPRRGGEEPLQGRERKLYERIVMENGGKRGGCGDIWAWRKSRHIFIEAKMGGRDRITSNQFQWFHTATTKCPLSKRSFCVVEWYFKHTR